MLSSMAMSLNSLDSKTSPHSRHSTYSDSSSRLTICTRGCLHWVIHTLERGLGGHGWSHKIRVELGSRAGVEKTPPKIAGILERSPKMSSTRFTGFGVTLDWRAAGCAPNYDANARLLLSRSVLNRYSSPSTWCSLLVRVARFGWGGLKSKATQRVGYMAD